MVLPYNVNIAARWLSFLILFIVAPAFLHSLRILTPTSPKPAPELGWRDRLEARRRLPSDFSQIAAGVVKLNCTS
jgi:hypothetical protein